MNLRTRSRLPSRPRLPTPMRLAARLGRKLTVGAYRAGRSMPARRSENPGLPERALGVPVGALFALVGFSMFLGGVLTVVLAYAVFSLLVKALRRGR